MNQLPTFLLIMTALLGSAVQAVEPAAVSPGGRTQVTTVASGCPTFSWSLIPGAKSLQVVVYRTDDDQLYDDVVDRLPVLERELPGSTTSWTPALEDCLPPGGSFAWAVLAIDADAQSSLSKPLFFRTPAAPTAIEIGRALEILQSWRLANSA